MRYLFALLLAFAIASPSSATNFPTLTGRVVDGAHILSAGAQQSLDAQLTNLEAQNGDQLVVVTVPSLDGQAIEEYGVALGRQWGIGQKGKNNGALLIVAPKEHKVRIEVGYGLEGTLTDAMTSNIIQGSILPQFKQGRMEQGVMNGVQAITSALKGNAIGAGTSSVSASQVHTYTYQGNTSDSHASSNSNGGGGWIVLLIVLFLFSQVVLYTIYLIGAVLGWILSLLGFVGLRNAMQRFKAKLLPMDRAILLWLLLPSHRVGGYTGNSGGGGFSGGGGSFGGGGSSGSW